MGSTQQIAVVKILIESLLARPQMAKYKETLVQMNWDDTRQVSNAFRKLIEILEIEVVV